MNEEIQFVSIENGKAVTTSRLIAEKFGKEHKNIIRSIRSMGCSLQFSRLNFEPRDYVDSRGKVQTEYIITKDGFTFLVFGFTGEQADQFKEEYIGAFNERGREIMRLKMQKVADDANKPLLLEIEHKQFLLAAANSMLEKNIRKAKYVDTVLLSKNTYTTSEVAAELDLTAQALNKRLHSMGIHYPCGKHWYLYAKYRGKGFQKSRTNVHSRTDGSFDTNVYPVWTETGRLFVHHKINPLKATA